MDVCTFNNTLPYTTHHTSTLHAPTRSKHPNQPHRTQGYHNAATKETGDNHCLLQGNKPAGNHPLYDSRLTPKGIAQAESLRAYLSRRPSGSRSFTAFDLVVVSPLTRTCETALHVFGAPRDPGKPAFLGLVDAPEGTPERAAGVKVAPPRFLVREECQERWGHYVCDGRRSIREISAEFPNFDFSEIVHDEDVFCSNIAFLSWSYNVKRLALSSKSSFNESVFQKL
jgi:hypothetical protein